MADGDMKLEWVQLSENSSRIFQCRRAHSQSSDVSPGRAVTADDWAKGAGSRSRALR